MKNFNTNRGKQRIARRKNVDSVQTERDAAFGGVVASEGEAALRLRDVVKERPDPAAGLAAGRRGTK